MIDLPCCGKSRSALCRETCRNILEIGETMQEIVDTLEKGGCGVPLPHDPLWQCFLADGHNTNTPENGLTSQINQIGIDSAKLHCCHKAQSPKCRRLCAQTFSNDWFETHRDFENDCYNQLNEVSLKQCVDEGNLLFWNSQSITSLLSDVEFFINSWWALWTRLWWSVILYKFQ